MNQFRIRLKESASNRYKEEIYGILQKVNLFGKHIDLQIVSFLPEYINVSRERKLQELKYSILIFLHIRSGEIHLSRSVWAQSSRFLIEFLFDKRPFLIYTPVNVVISFVVVSKIMRLMPPHKYAVRYFISCAVFACVLDYMEFNLMTNYGLAERKKIIWHDDS